MSAYVYIIGMCLITAVIRILPLLILRRPIRNRFLRSFFYYVPFVTLSVMTFPAIVMATSNPVAGVAALVAGIILAWVGANMITVSAACCVLVFILELIIR
jgi:branched-subunit amino acid transport protein